MRQPVGLVHPFAFGRKLPLARAAVSLIFTIALLSSVGATPQAGASKPPQTLRETGLYANAESLEVDPQHLAFSPQYPLWTDGAAKKRWISLPPGTAIDGSD